MLRGDAYRKKMFAVGVVQRGNRSTLTAGTVTIKNRANLNVQDPCDTNIMCGH